MQQSDLPATPELQAAVLPSVIRLLGGSRTQQEPMLPAVVQTTGSLVDVIDRLATRLQLTRDAVESVYTVDGDGVQISVDPRRIGPSKSAATRELALLVAAQRQAAGEEQTSVDEIRTVTIEFGKYDPPNFSSSINELRGAFLVKGPPRQRLLKLTRTGWAQAADLVRELAGRT